jgi:predicted nicotinamide N-methyase
MNEIPGVPNGGSAAQPAPGRLPGTEYRGPVVVSEHHFGGRTIRLVRPSDPDVMLDDPRVDAWNRTDDYMPYWAYLWPGAYLLADQIARDPWPFEPRQSDPALALEIGCGLGLAGLVGVARGLRVQFTDYDQAPLDFVVRSAHENGFDPAHYSTRRLDWRHLPEERYPIIFGSDVLYEAGLVSLVAGLLYRLLAPGGVGLIATPYRVTAREFPAALASLGLSCHAEDATAQGDEGQAVNGTIYRVTRS